MTSNNDQGLDTPTDKQVWPRATSAYLVVANVRVSYGTSHRCFETHVVALRFDRQQVIRELRETVYKSNPHGRFRDQALNAEDLLTHYRKHDTAKLGLDEWWISSDRLLWISHGVHYRIHELDASAPFVLPSAVRK